MRDDRRPASQTFSNPLYSDAGYIVLGRVLERMTNSTYSEALRTLLVEPLGLEGTSTLMPEGDDLNAVALPGDWLESNWFQPNQLTAP